MCHYIIENDATYGRIATVQTQLGKVSCTFLIHISFCLVFSAQVKTVRQIIQQTRVKPWWVCYFLFLHSRCYVISLNLQIMSIKCVNIERINKQRDTNSCWCQYCWSVCYKVHLLMLYKNVYEIVIIQFWLHVL